MGDSFGDMSTAGPTEIAKVTATMGLNITYMFVLFNRTHTASAIASGVSGFLASFFFAIGSQRLGNKLRQEFFNQVTRQEIGYFDIKKGGALIHSLSDDAEKTVSVFSVHLQNVVQVRMHFTSLTIVESYASSCRIRISIVL
jgi:ATP-binding cassette subfamily B (MDR/TAP) protein 1